MGVVQDHCCGGTAAHGVPDAPSHASHTTDDRSARAAEAVGEAPTQRMADDKDLIEIEAVGGAEELEKRVEECVVPKGITRLPGLIPAVLSVLSHEPSGVYEDSRRCGALLDLEVPLHLAIGCGASVEGEDQSVSQGRVVRRRNRGDELAAHVANVCRGEWVYGWCAPTAVGAVPCCVGPEAWRGDLQDQQTDRCEGLHGFWTCRSASSNPSRSNSTVSEPCALGTVSTIVVPKRICRARA